MTAGIDRGVDPGLPVRGMGCSYTVEGVTWRFADLRELLARASPARSGGALAGLAAD